MPESYRALCTDFYVNQKISVRMDLPRTRESTLDLFERVRREFPDMTAFRRYKDELALEGPQGVAPHRWIAIRPSNVRSGVVNPASDEDAFGLHKRLLEITPYYLSISPLDIEYLELLFGFDLSAPGNHDRIVAEALLADSPLGAFADESVGGVADFQPVLGMTLDPSEEIEAHFEVKTRSTATAAEGEQREEPISVYVTLRQYAPVDSLERLGERFERLARRGSEIVDDRVISGLIAPLRHAIASRSL